MGEHLHRLSQSEGRQSETVEFDAPAPRTRTGVTGLMRVASGGPRPLVSTVLLVLLGSGLGAGGVSASGIGDDRIEALDQKSIERVADVIAKVEARDAKLAADIAAQTDRIALIDARTLDAERRLWGEQIRATRWMADILVKHSNALAAIADELNVDVDVAVPPLLSESSAP